MDIPDDSALWFCPRPVDDFSNTDFSETEFLRTQVAAIEAYVERFPWDEREFRALAWIEANASQYRHQWQTKAAISTRQVQPAIAH